MTTMVACVAVAAATLLVATGAASRGATARGDDLAPHPSRRAQVRAGDWAALLDVVAAEVRSGSSLDTAWRAAWRRHQLVGRALRPGMTLRDIGPDRCTADEAVVVHVIGAAAAIGGAAAATIDAGAALLREREAARADAHAHSAQARLSAQVLTAVPLVFAGWNFATSDTVRAASTTPAGLVALTSGAACNVAGWVWMRRIVERASR